MSENIYTKGSDDGLPDSKNCRAREFTSFDYELVSCLIEYPVCKFNLYFGASFLCRHPRRKEIAERTKAMLNNSASQSQ